MFTVAQAGAGAVVVARLLPGAWRLAPLVPCPGPVPDRVSVVIPARNEARRIGPCLAALAADPQVHEVIVVDDESTDGTAVIASEGGARVLSGRPLPAGWVGKPWALQQGLEAATGEWILTLDADTVPGDGLVGSLVSACLERGADLVTAGPRFRCDAPGEQTIHASLLATLIYRFGPVGPRRRPSPARTMANGQCLIARRSWLIGQGGFDLAGTHMTDDIALVRAFAARGARIDFLDGANVVDVDMHDGPVEVWREWGRSLPMADVTPPLRQAADLAVVWLAMALPLPRLVAHRGTVADAALLALRLGVVAATSGAYRPPRRELAAAPLFDVAAATRLTLAALRPVRTWRGRTYPG